MKVSCAKILVRGVIGGILSLIENETLCRRFETEIQKKNFEGKGEIEKFLAFLTT